MNLIQYIQKYATRGPCTCGRCIDAVANPESKQPQAIHTADVVFFKVTPNAGIDTKELTKKIAEHEGEFCACNLFDGAEHSYLEVGGWLGDQGLALTLMGLGECLGLWKLLTPRSVLGKDVPEDLVQKMAGAGYVSIQATHITP